MTINRLDSTQDMQETDFSESEAKETEHILTKKEIAARKKKAESLRLSEKKKKADQISIMITPEVQTKEQAINAKMSLLNTKLFGTFSIVTYELISERKVYLPFDILRYSYELELFSGDRHNKKEGLFHRDAQVGVVYNVYEDHAFHYDLHEEIRRKHLDKIETYATILPDAISEKEELENTERYLKRKILGKAYRNSKNIKLEQKERFYRPAYELIVKSRDKEFVKFAYLDEYESSNEHISGLRPRLDLS